ncbi:unnamed protein product [Penicillium salamii]|uniref:AB hydrolase-1 domain-containing protein n=1 Tax=Penicillium salamii TaxID=1612424 RepID=A0A9W4JPA9_9EURO|nr:unnamed protein product [Penicillium salamii]
MGPPTTKQANLFSGVRVFYREQGNTVNAPTILLHGFPSSSHQFRNLMPLLATKYRVVAPDLPGFGFTEAPSNFVYTFESLTATVADFLDLLEIQKFTMYIFDYGAPVGLRLALQRPDAIQAIITQNGNAYLEGFGAAWQPLKDFWVSNDSLEDRKKIEDAMLTFEAIKFQYENGTPDVPLFAIWGKNDVFFIPAGAEAFKRDLPSAEIKLIDAGHFAVESDTELIAQDILTFLIEKTLWELDVGMGVM